MIGETMTPNQAFVLLSTFCMRNAPDSEELAELVYGGFLREVRTERSLYFALTDAGAQILHAMLKGASWSPQWRDAHLREVNSQMSRRREDRIEALEVNASHVWVNASHVWDDGICVNCKVRRATQSATLPCKAIVP